MEASAGKANGAGAGAAGAPEGAAYVQCSEGAVAVMAMAMA